MAESKDSIPVDNSSEERDGSPSKKFRTKSPREHDSDHEFETSPNGGGSKRNRKSGKPRLPHLNTFDVPEFMKGAQPGASAVQKAEFEDRCKLLWRKSQAEERQHIKEANKRAEKNMENMVKDLMEMFPAIEEQLVRDTLLQHDLDSQAAAQVLIVLSGSCDPSTQPPASSSTKPSKPDQPVIQHDDLNEFPAMAPPRVDSEGWEKLPDHVMKQQDNAQNWGEKAKGVPEDWAEVNSQVRQSSPRGINGYSSPRAASPRSSTGNAPQTDAIDIDDFDCELEHDLRKGIGHKAHHNTKVRDKAAPTIRSKPPGFKKETE